MKKHFKKISIRSIAVLLSVLLSILSFPLSVFAIEGNADADLPVSKSVEKDIIELIDERTATTKRFRLEDGSYMVAQYDTDVHYLDEDGTWQNIDNTLAVSGSDITTSDAKIKFAKKTTGNETLFALHDGNRKLTLSLNGAAKKVTGEITNYDSELGEDTTKLEKMTTLNNISASVLYSEILPNTDLEYVIKGKSIKENIIVKSKADAYSYTFTLSLNNLTASLNADNVIEIFDANTEELAYRIPAPVMWDANNALSNDISVSLTDRGNGNYTLMITPSAEWINNESRVFPVTVDPPIYPASNLTVLDLYVSQTESASDTVNSPYLRVGKGHHAYWKLLSLPTLPASSYITNAFFTTRGSLEGDVEGYIGLYEVLSNWDETMIWPTANSNISEFYTDYENSVTSAISVFTDWNVTPLVKKWYSGCNYGLALAPMDPNSFSGYVKLYSNNNTSTHLRPALCIEYVDMKGLEDYWSYTSQSAGFAGSGSINHATGNLVFAIPTLTTTDALMPFTPTLVYNSALADMRYAYPSAQTAYGITSAAAASMPLGFKLNIQETLICKSYVDQNNATKDLYIWADADGTEHCFRSTGSNSVYKDEDGLLLELTANASTVTIKDSGDNVRTFSKLSTQPSGIVSSWYLTSIADKIGNKVVFEVDSSYRPIAIKLDPVSVEPIEQMRLWYNANGKLGAVYNPYSKEAVILRYNGNYLSELLRVHTNSAEAINDSFWSSFYSTYPSSYNSGKYIVDATAAYTFDDLNGFLVSAENGLTSYRLTYEYDLSLCKVVGVFESAAGDYYTQDGSTYYSVGQGIRLTYNAESTVIRTSGTDDILMTSDDLLTTYGFDYYGRSVSAYTTDLNQTVLYGASNGQYVGEENENAKNNLKSSVQTVQHSSNYLLNGGFEQSNGSSGAQYWTAASGSVARVPSIGGDSGAALQLTVGGSVYYSEAYQMVYLPLDQYTLSARVKTQNAQGAEICLRVESDYQTFETIVPKNDKNVSNGYVTVEVDVNAAVTDYYTVSLIVSGSDVSTSVYFDQLMLSRTTGVSEYDTVRMGHFETTHGNSPSPLSQWTTFGGSASIVSSGSNSYETFWGDVLKIEGDFMNGGGITQVIYEASEESREMYDVGFIESNPSRVFTVSGWGKGTAQSYSDFSSFGIIVEIEYYKGEDQYSTDMYSFDFSKDITDWQFVSGGVATNPVKGLLNKIEISVLYLNNPGIGYFDNITLIENSTTTNVYTYNQAGYLTSQINGSNWTYCYYDETNEDEDKRNNLITSISSDKTITRYTYDPNNRVAEEFIQKYSGTFDPRIGLGSVTATNVAKYSYTYFGLFISSIFTYDVQSGSTPNLCHSSSYTYYAESGSHIYGALKSEKPETIQNATNYFYDENTGRLKAAILPDGTGVYYEYDGMGNLTAVYPATWEDATGVEYDTDGASVNYEYEAITKRLSKINTETTQYKFTYDEFGNSTEIEAGGRTLLSYEYKKVLVDDGNITDYVPVNGKLETLTYGNGLKVKYLYDSLDRVEEVLYNIGTNGAFVTVYTYQYDTNGRLFSVTDHQNNQKSRYVYDFGGNLLKTYTTDLSTDTILSSEEIKYDEYSRLSQITQPFEYSYSGGIGRDLAWYYFTYNEATGELSTLTIYTNNFKADIEFIVDPMGRLATKKVFGNNFYNRIDYDYTTLLDNWESYQISEVISKVTLGEHEGTTISNTRYNYAYDENGNITQISKNGTVYYRYEYDELGQLKREDNRGLNKSYVWTYDDAGNIQTKSTYAFTTGTLGAATSTVTYGYNDATWGDLLTYDGYYEIAYDSIGNPTDLFEYWEDGGLVSGIHLVWQGRQLVGYHYGEGYSGEIDEYYSSITFTYNADGIRIGKNVYGTEYEYIVSGSQILAEKWTSGGVEYFLQYLYDESGSPIGINYRTSQYAENVFDVFYFEKNLQGDIVAIYNDSGTKIGTYTYDAWGNFTVSTTSGITATERNIVRYYNPFRYRGYYYDVDMGMYYLQSRYYNPQWGRFLNADSPAIVASFALADKNLFAYCDNNPVMRTDGSGYAWETVFDIVSLGFSIIDVCKDPSDPWAWVGLVGDAVDLIPFVTGVGEVTRTVSTGRKVLKAADNLHDAGKAIDNATDAIDGTIDTYKALKKADSSIGKEVHHIVEKRMGAVLGFKDRTGDMLSIALDKKTHRYFTNEWRKVVPYGTNYSDLGQNGIWKAAQTVYRNHPELLEAARKTIFG